MRRLTLLGALVLVLALAPAAQAKQKPADLRSAVTTYIVSSVTAGSYSIEYFRVTRVRREGPYQGTVYFTLAADGRKAILFKVFVACEDVRGTRRACFVGAPETIG